MEMRLKSKSYIEIYVSICRYIYIYVSTVHKHSQVTLFLNSNMSHTSHIVSIIWPVLHWPIRTLSIAHWGPVWVHFPLRGCHHLSLVFFVLADWGNKTYSCLGRLYVVKSITCRSSQVMPLSYRFSFCYKKQQLTYDIIFLKRFKS